MSNSDTRQHVHKHQDISVEENVEKEKHSKTQTSHIPHNTYLPIEGKEKTAIMIIGVIELLLFFSASMIIYNQFQIATISGSLSGSGGHNMGSMGFSRSASLEGIDISTIKSTAQTVGTVFPVSEWKTQDDVIAAMLPSGTPEYGDALGVSFDRPEESLQILAQMFEPLKAQVKNNNPQAYERWLNMASNPMGMSCEFCCGVGPIAVDKNGNLKCGCQHIPALNSVGLWLAANTDYSDGEILREVMRWKTMFFPQKMVALGASLTGADAQTVGQLPGMVGGC
ncbi:MAG: hypothetical protein WC916_00235 [Candidatus Woesearchaeota archaeon]